MTDRQQVTTVRLLLVEDEELIREATAEGLRGYGFEIVEAANAEDAMRQIDQDPRLGVIVTDVRMPGKLDGIDAALYARRRNPTIPVIVVSGCGMNYAARMEQFRPAAVFIDKPYQVARVASTAERMLGHASAKQRP